MKHATAGRIKIGSAVLPTLEISADIAVVAEHNAHSALLHPTNVMVAGCEVPYVRAKIPLDIALTTFGLNTTGYAAAGTVEAYFADIVGGVISGGSTHSKWALAADCLACAWINSVSVAEGSEAVAELMIAYFSDDGATDPIAQTDSNALPALSAVPNIHGIGPATLNGVVYDGVTGFSYECGLQLAFQRVSGQKFATGAVPSATKPMLSIELADYLTVAATLGRSGATIGSSTLIAFHRYANSALSATGQRTLTAAAGFIRPKAPSGRHGEYFRGGVEILPTSSNGTTHGLAVG